jgi:hypothetical protein
VLKAIYERQLDGEITTLEQGLELARVLVQGSKGAKVQGSKGPKVQESLETGFGTLGPLDLGPLDPKRLWKNAPSCPLPD